MPLLIGKNTKKSLRNEEGDKWYPYVKSRGTITEEEVARLVTRRTSLDMNMARMVIANLQEVVIEKVLEGYTVMLGDWGYFYATVNGEPSATPEEVKRNKIKRVRMHLSLSKDAVQALQRATFVFIEDLASSDTSTEEEERY